MPDNDHQAVPGATSPHERPTTSSYNAETLAFTIGRAAAFGREIVVTPTPAMRREARWLVSRLLPVLFGGPCSPLDLAVARQAVSSGFAGQGTRLAWHAQLAAFFDRWPALVVLCRDANARALVAQGPIAVAVVMHCLPRYLNDAPSVVLEPPAESIERLGTVLTAHTPSAYNRERRKNGVQAGERLARAWVETVGLHWPEETSARRKTARRRARSNDVLRASPASLFSVAAGPPPITSVADQNGEPSPELLALCEELERTTERSGNLAVPVGLPAGVECSIAPLIMLAYGPGSPDDSPIRMIDAGLRAAFGLEPWQARWWALFDANATELAKTKDAKFVRSVCALALESLDPAPDLAPLLDPGMRLTLVSKLKGYSWATLSPGRTALSSFGFASRWARTCKRQFPERAPRGPALRSLGPRGGQK